MRDQDPGKMTLCLFRYKAEFSSETMENQQMTLYMFLCVVQKAFRLQHGGQAWGGRSQVMGRASLEQMSVVWKNLGKDQREKTEVMEKYAEPQSHLGKVLGLGGGK